jgi:SPP1 gp7 family putative phage head morphogenesis protein
MKRRFQELVKVTRKAVAEEDVFGLEAPKVFQMTTPGQRAFAFERSAKKIESFLDWLQAQIDAGILQLGYLHQIGQGTERAWTNLYILDSYKRGVIRARYELQKAGYDVPSLDSTGGIDASMSSLFHVDRVGLIYTRVFNELKGITADMDKLISRVLAQGLVDGDSPRLLARKLVSVINGSGAGDLSMTDTLGRFIPASRRAMILARTEIIRAHHLATIQEYRNWALEGVYVKAEWMTAGDNRVCDKCASLQGKIYTLDEIESMIPFHPLCRCIALPVLVTKE